MIRAICFNGVLVQKTLTIKINSMINTSTLQKSEKTITIDFPIGEVKKSISRIIRLLDRKYTFMENGVNDVFNLYEFAIHNGLIVGIANISLEYIDPDKTKLTMTVTNAYGSTASNSILDGMAADFLNALSRTLMGKPLTSGAGKVSNSSGCTSVLVSIIIIAVLTILFFL